MAELLLPSGLVLLTTELGWKSKAHLAHFFTLMNLRREVLSNHMFELMTCGAGLVLDHLVSKQQDGCKQLATHLTLDLNYIVCFFSVAKICLQHSNEIDQAQLLRENAKLSECT